jgi:S-adenosylmethionine:tRNA ribosyltransferase-isomerase
MRVNDFDYKLPPDLIAQHPSQKREASRMMILNRMKGEIKHKYFYNIIDYLRPDDLLIINNTQVIPARLFGKKETGANIEIFLIQQIDNTIWQCLLRPQKRIRAGIKIIINDEHFVEVLEREPDGKWLIQTPEQFDKIIYQLGNMPLPPYIKRDRKNKFEPEDRQRYQTVYASIPGAVAAPTAGLHFTPEIMTLLKEKGVHIAELTLHVGMGTFKPVKCDSIKNHVMHKEYYHLSEEAARQINSYKAEKKRIVAVGTTSIRTLETIASENNGKIIPASGWSQIFIYPGYQFKVVDSCITNFHLPRSTLIMLVSAFAGKDFIFKAYNEAIQEKYRFYSYGDCMFIQ